MKALILCFKLQRSLLPEKISSCSYCLVGSDLVSIHHPPTYKTRLHDKAKAQHRFPAKNQVREAEKTHYIFQSCWAL